MKTISFSRSVSFVVLIGALVSLYKYSFFNAMQIDMLPIIFREMDPNFLMNDLYTNVSEQFNEDFIFAKFIAWCSFLLPVPIVFFLLTLLSNIGIAFVGFLSARDLSNKNNLTGLIGAILLITTSTLQWGNRDILFRYELTPEHLVMPFILLAIWKGIKQKPLLVGLFAGIATFSHPLTGPGVGGLMLLQILITQYKVKKVNSKLILNLVLAGFMLLIPLLLHLIPYFKSFETSISDDLFIEIMSVRFPQHYLASYFLTPMRTFVGISFLAAGFLSWRKWRENEEPSVEYYYSVFPISLMLLILCFLGWFFSEVFPTRLMYTLHPFRFILIFKYIGLLAMALFTGSVINSTNSYSTKISSVIAVFYPPLLLVHQFLIKKRDVLPIYVPVIYFSLIYLLKDSIRGESGLFALFSILFFLLYLKWNYFKMASIFLIIGVLLNIFIIDKSSLLRPISKRLGKYFNPKISFESYGDDEVLVARFIQSQTPENSLILVPPKGGRLRIFANRAVVIDGYSIPMNDAGLDEWWYRVNAVYNKGTNKKLKHISETGRNYNQLTDSDLLELQQEFQFQYAVVKASHKTDYEIAYKNEGLKLLDFSKFIVK